MDTIHVITLHFHGTNEITESAKVINDAANSINENLFRLVEIIVVGHSVRDDGRFEDTRANILPATTVTIVFMAINRQTG